MSCLFSVIMCAIVTEDVYGPALYMILPSMAPENGTQLAELQSMIGDSAQPWASVSPLFTNLAATWTSLQVGGMIYVERNPGQFQ